MLFSVTIILLIISGISIITELSVVITAIILVIAIIMRIITGGVGLGLYLTVSQAGPLNYSSSNPPVCLSLSFRSYGISTLCSGESGEQ